MMNQDPATRQRKAIHARENPNSPEAEEWRKALGRDLDTCLKITDNGRRPPTKGTK